jgi:nuclear cap-binding protein subunit 1
LNFGQILDVSIAALRTADASDFESGAFMQPYASQTPVDATAVFDLPNVLVPPEVIELEGGNVAGEGDGGIQIKKEEWPEWHLSLFENTVLFVLPHSLARVESILGDR